MVYIFIGLIGLVLGSFTNAFVWRLHEQENKKSKFKKADLSITKGRSMCPHCGHQLAWYDLIPVFSWISLGGKCRYCKKPISVQYPLVEVAVAFLLATSYYFWPYEFTASSMHVAFAVWTILLVLLVSMVVYDIKWMILPTKLVYSTLVLSAASILLISVDQQDIKFILSALVGSIGLGGLFWLLYQISDGKWIGGGDVRLGFSMGLFLGWQKSLIGLSLSAYIGTIIIIIALLLGKYHRRMKLPFGPLLVAGWYISFLWGQSIIDWYLRLIGVH